MILLISSKSHLSAPRYPGLQTPTSIIYEPIFNSIFISNPGSLWLRLEKGWESLRWASFFHLIHKSSIKQIKPYSPPLLTPEAFSLLPSGCSWVIKSQSSVQMVETANSASNAYSARFLLILCVLAEYL